MRKRVSGARREGRISLRPRSRRTRMLKCQRNDESSFAVSASTCIRRKEGDSRGGIGRVRGGAAGKRGVGDKGSRARRRTRGTYVCTHGVCLSRCCLPCSFLRSSINETRVQSRRMSNKYVSYPRPPFRGTFAPTGRLLTLFTLFLLNSRVTASFLVALLRESSSYHDQCRPASAHFNPLLLLPSARPPSLSASGRFDPEQNHRSIRAYMLLTALSLPSPLHSARR